MAKVILDTINGEQEYDIPLAVAERTFGRFCDFKALEQLYWDKVREGGAEYREENDLPPMNALDILKHTQEITTAFESMMATIIDGNIADIEFSIEGDSPTKLIENKYHIGLEDDISLMRLYAHWVTIVDAFKPEKVPRIIKMDMEGTTCELTKERVEILFMGEGTTAGQLIEILEFRRRCLFLAETVKSEATGNLDFNLGTTEMSLLVLPKGVKLPHKRGPLMKHINEWKKKWEFVPLDELLTIRFFLVGTIMNWLANNYIPGFLNKQKNRKQQKQKTVGRNKPNWQRKQRKRGMNRGFAFITTSALRKASLAQLQTLYKIFLKPR